MSEPPTADPNPAAVTSPVRSSPGPVPDAPGYRSGRFAFTVLAVEPAGRARRGRFVTPHGPVETPTFMPVATQGAIKGLDADQLRATGAQICLGNTYHLALRPGDELVAELGGLHRFMRWDGPILTDSGGFQVFSLADRVKVTERAALFRSHIDGRAIELSPERSIEIQERLGADVAMVLDHVIALPAPRDQVRDALERTLRWAQRCRDAGRRPEQAQFAIVQGGLDRDLRLECVERLTPLPFEGFALGGLSVGETPAQMYEVLEYAAPALPADKPRYLMGVGRPQDLLEAVARGVDFFDCVMPTRNGRNALAFTDAGPIRMRNARFLKDTRPLEDDCPCSACRYSRAYLRHLFMAEEMLGPILLSIHNLTYYQRLMHRTRAAIEAGRFAAFHAERLAGWAENEPSLPAPDSGPPADANDD